MAIIHRILGENVFYDFWKQIQQYVFSEKRLVQLFTFQPIEIYKSSTDIEFDGVKVKLQVASTLENLMQRRINRTLDFLTLSTTEKKGPSFVYDFDIVIRAQMLHEEVSKFFSNHFAQQTHTIKENRYFLHINAFKFSSMGTKLQVSMPFYLHVQWGPFRRKMNGVAIFTGAIDFHQPKNSIRIRNLHYRLETGSTLLKAIDRLYHATFLSFLNNFLQYNFREEIFHAKTEAQLQLNTIQDQTSWMNGSIQTLDLDRVTLEAEGIEAVFLAKGKLHMVR